MAGRYPAYAAALSDDSLDNVADAMEGQDHAMSLKAMVEEAALTIIRHAGDGRITHEELCEQVGFMVRLQRGMDDYHGREARDEDRGRHICRNAEIAIKKRQEPLRKAALTQTLKA